MTAARRLPQTRLHRGAGTQPHTAARSRRPIIGIADSRLKDACRRRCRGPGSALVLDPGRPLTRDGSDRKQATPRVHARPRPRTYFGVPGDVPEPERKGTKSLLTPARSFRNDLTRDPSLDCPSSPPHRPYNHLVKIAPPSPSLLRPPTGHAPEPLRSVAGALNGHMSTSGQHNRTTKDRIGGQQVCLTRPGPSPWSEVR